MSGFVLHPDLYHDLDEIWEYIAADNIEAADRVLEQIYAAIQTLVSFPQLGHLRPDLAPAPIRFHLVREYLLAYASNEEPLLVLAVLHGRRNPRVLAAIIRVREK
jgi:plasmid stabilization system protein ParE